MLDYVSNQNLLMMDLQVRQAAASESCDISEVAIAAFGVSEGNEIAALIAELLADPSAQPLLSLVATIEDRVVGHILFTNVLLKGCDRPVSSTILAPLAVSPEYQNRGIGGKLIEEGFKHLQAGGGELVFVLGHPGYYPKFGFVPAGIEGLNAPHPIPPEKAGAWMVRELQPGAIASASGRVMCAETLSDPKYWRE